MKPRSVNGCLRALKAMLNYFVGEEVLDVSPMRRVRLVREPEAMIPVYSDAQLLRLLFPKAGGGFLDLRDMTMLRFLFDTGVRAAELCDLKVDNLDLTERTALVRHSFAKAHVLNGGDAFSLQRMLGHADISTTQKYVDLNLREVRRQHDAYGPLDRLGERER